MNDLSDLFACLGITKGLEGKDPFKDRVAIAHMLAERLEPGTNKHWFDLIAVADLWAAPVMDWHDLMDSSILQNFGIIGKSQRSGQSFSALLAPLRFYGARPVAKGAAPYLNEELIFWSIR